MSQIRPEEFPNGSATANDVTGYVSPTGREYAILGLQRGTGFVDVTDPVRSRIVAEVRDADSFWSDVDVYEQFAYNVNESGGGLQVIDLSGIDQGEVILVGAATGGLATSHTIFVNPRSGYLYACLNSLTFGFIAYDLSRPYDPMPVGSWREVPAHEVYVTTYDSCPYAGRADRACEIAFVFAAGAGLRVVDVTDKAAMFTIASLRYPNLAYCHQGWLSEDRRHLFFGDEFDEQRHNFPATTYVLDVSVPNTLGMPAAFSNGINTVDHNLMVRGRFVFEANYTSGLRIFDAGDIQNIREVGFFDTFPESDARVFEGAWGVYAGLPSGNILVSDIVGGLFVLDPKEAVGCGRDSECNDFDPCTADACAAGTCVHDPLPPDATCEDGDPCTVDGQCDLQGACISRDVRSMHCNHDADCFPGICVPSGGYCVCEACRRADPLLPDTFPLGSNRYLPVSPANPGALTALRVTLIEGPAAVEGCKGRAFWVSRPLDVSEQAKRQDATPPTVRVARLVEEPVFRDWGSTGRIHVFGQAIIPGAAYKVEAITASCASLAAANFSLPHVLRTGRWGDVVGTCSVYGCSSPDGRVDAGSDAMMVLSKFANRPGSVSKIWTDLDPAAPDQQINIADLTRVLDAFRGAVYPFGGPPGCD